MKTPTRFLLIAALLLGLGSTARALDLTVEVNNARSAQGTVDGALFGAGSSWLREPLKGERQPAAAKVLLVYRDLPAGAYALSVFHDENGNGKLDANVAGIPLERYGFSRDAHGRMGPPSFADAVIDLQADTAITINLR
jgi:uncharacterized protein (DUF2141 family)